MTIAPSDAHAELHPAVEYEQLQQPNLREQCMNPTTRERIRELADRLPPDATMEDAIERLVFLTKIDRGIAEANAGKLADHEEVERELGRSPVGWSQNAGEVMRRGALTLPQTRQR